MSDRTKQYLVFSSSIACSIGWFLYALRTGQPSVAGRGGDVGMAITLGFLFVKSDLAPRMYTVLRRDAPDLLARIRGHRQERGSQHIPPTIEDLERRIDLLAKSITSEERGQHRADLLLAAATVLGTLVAAFGESVAAMLLAN